MVARLDYLVKTRNRFVVAYSSDGGGGNVSFDVGPSAFGSNLPNPANEYPVSTTGLTFTSAAISRVVGSAGGGGGNIEIAFAGSTPYQAYQLPFASAIDGNFEKFTIPNLASGSTGMATITNRLSSGATASFIIEFVSRHVS
jgi:hypothetical protein